MSHARRSARRRRTRRGAQMPISRAQMPISRAQMPISRSQMPISRARCYASSGASADDSSVRARPWPRLTSRRARPWPRLTSRRTRLWWRPASTLSRRLSSARDCKRSRDCKLIRPRRRAHRPRRRSRPRSSSSIPQRPPSRHCWYACAVMSATLELAALPSGLRREEEGRTAGAP